MAKKKEVAEAGKLSETESGEVEAPTIRYEDLIAAQVKVTRGGVALFYLDASHRAGDFVLRPIPQPMEAPGEIPNEWRRPTVEENQAADPKIDWDVPQAKE